MKGRIKYSICYPVEKTDTAMLEDWCTVICGCFTPLVMSGSKLTGGKRIPFLAERFFTGLEQELMESHISVHLSDRQNNLFITGDRERTKTVIFTVLIHKDKDCNPVDELIEKYMSRHGIVAHKRAGEDHFWQNATNPLYYSAYGRSMDGVKLTKRKTGPAGELIDIEANPGHDHISTRIWFGSCYQMWFGKDYYRFIPREKICGFTDCFENAELGNGVQRVTLYENMWDFDLPKSRETQSAFRRSLDIDRVAHAVESVKLPPSNPDIEISERTCKINE